MNGEIAFRARVNGEIVFRLMGMGKLLWARANGEIALGPL